MKTKSKTNKTPTIKDIAKKAGVSPSTVSRVISNPTIVSSAKKEAVNAVINEMSYTPSLVARGLARGLFPGIHVIITNICNPAVAESVRGIQDAAMGSGYSIVFGNTDDLPEREIEYLSLAKEHHFAGVILISTAGGTDLKRALMELDSPIVLVNRLIPGFQANAVLTNNERGGYIATKYLINLGHKNICHLAGLKKSTVSAGRLQGFIKAMKDSGLEIPEGGMRYVGVKLELGEDIGNRLVKEGLRFSAFFTVNDQIAIGLMSAFEAHGIRIPEDVSIIGFDDIAYARLPGIRLTTMKQPIYEMGKVAVNMLLEQIRGQSSAFRSIIFEPELIKRNTCGPLKT